MTAAVILNKNNKIIEWLPDTALKNGAAVRWSRRCSISGDLVKAKRGKISRAKKYLNNKKGIYKAQVKNYKSSLWWEVL